MSALLGARDLRCFGRLPVHSPSKSTLPLLGRLAAKRSWPIVSGMQVAIENCRGACREDSARGHTDRLEGPVWPSALPSLSARGRRRDGGAVLAETDASQATVAYVNHTPQLQAQPEGSRRANLVSQRRSGATSFHHYDALGSTRALTNAAQTVTDTRDYRAFGLTNTSGGSTINRFWWVGNLGYYP